MGGQNFPGPGNYQTQDEPKKKVYKFPSLDRGLLTTDRNKPLGPGAYEIYHKEIQEAVSPTTNKGG
jgi:hypothetical protein